MVENNLKNNIPIDAVITWVDGNDKDHQEKMLPFVEKKLLKLKEFRTRFDQVDEIKFTVDSILKFAPFIRNIYIVTDNQVPSFLKSEIDQLKYSNVSIVDHKIIFSGSEEHLPTFNCRPIETRLYKIPELSEHFVYFNDDMFLINPTRPTDFFINGYPVLRGKWLKFDEDRFLKRINEKFFRKKKIDNHRAAQQKGAKIAGFKKYYKFHHVPYALRKSTFENFFNSNKSVETENIRYKFRSLNQYTPQGLVNHLEIKNNTCVLNKNLQLIYLKPHKRPLWELKYKLRNRENKLFLCMQSLDRCESKKLNYILNWLTFLVK